MERVNDQYIVISEHLNLIDFTKRVNFFINLGYVPTGGIFIQGDHTYFQALYKK